MGTALIIRQDYTVDDLRQFARRGLAPPIACFVSDLRRRLSEPGCLSGRVRLQFVCDWVERFNQHGPDGLKTGKAKGREPLLNDKQRKALVEAVEKGPTPYLDGVVRWRLVDLVQWLWQEYRISVSRQTLGRELKAMGYRKLTARPKHHAQDMR